VKILQKVLGGGLLFDSHCICKPYLKLHLQQVKFVVYDDDNNNDDDDDEKDDDDDIDKLCI